MKKRLLVLLMSVAVLTLTFISCDADLRSQITDLMDSVSGNVFLENGLLEVDVSDAAATVASVTTIGSNTLGNEPVTFGTFPVTVPAGTTPLAPMDSDEQDELETNLKNTFKSEPQIEALIEDLGEDATDEQQEAAEDSVDFLNEVLQDFADELPDGQLKTALQGMGLTASGNMNKGDILLVQIMTNLISDTIKILDDLEGNLIDLTDEELEEHEDALRAIIEDAQFALEVANRLSGMGGIDFSGQIDFSTLVSDLVRGSRDLSAASDQLGTINALAPDIIAAMGVVKVGESYSFTADAYSKFIANQNTILSAIGLMNGVYDILPGNEDNSNALTTMVNLVLAEVASNFDDFCDLDNSRVPYTIIENYLNANKKLVAGTLTVDDSLTEFPLFSDIQDYLESLDYAYFEGLVVGLQSLNENGGISVLDDVFDNLLDGDLLSWYNGLVE
jgi:hypothetical protein